MFISALDMDNDKNNNIISIFINSTYDIVNSFNDIYNILKRIAIIRILRQ